MKKLLLFLFIGSLALTFCCGRSGPSHVILHPTKTGISTIRFHDGERSRPVITEVWYPVDEEVPADPVEGLWVRCAEARDAPLKASSKKYPLVIMSHGNWGDRLNNSWIAETLAANGFIVASMDHYGNTWNNKIAECFIKIWDRPQDVSFVIDQLLQDERFGPHINSEKIGLIGYSLGGHTAIWIAGGTVNHFDKPDLKSLPPDQLPSTVNDEVIDSIDFSPARSSYKDPRVSAVFVMAPALGYMFDLASLQNISVPVYIVAAEGDKTVPLDSSPNILASKIKKAVMTLIPGSASHYVFLNEVTKGGKLLLDKRVALDPPTVDRAKIHDEIKSTAVLFFDKHLK
jgi:predicted dienelactone hydrolase